MCKRRMRPAALFAAAFSPVFFLSPPALGDDAAPGGEDGPDTITVTATRKPQPATEVPATVTVFDADKIADQLASDIRDVIRFEPGVSVRRAPSRFGAAFGSTGRAGNEGFNIRGIEGDRVLIQVDGIRVPDGFSFGAQAAGRGDFVDVSIVKSVEIVRGPASALYGSDGLAGAVSFITSDPDDFLVDDDRIAGFVRAGYDTADDEFTETATIALGAGEFSALAAYTRRDGKELENQGANESLDVTRTAPNPQDTASNAFLGKLVWAPDDDNRLRLTVEHLDAVVETEVFTARAPAPVVSPTGVIDLDARDTTKRDRVSLDWRRETAGPIDYLQISAFWQDGRNRQFSDEDRNVAADRTRLNTFENRVIGAAAEFRSAFKTGAVEHTILYGGDVSITRQQGLRDGTVPTPPDVFPTRAFPVTDFILSGVYLADEIVFGDGAFRLFPALRWDYYKIDPREDPLLPPFFTGAAQSDDRLSPKVGAVVRLPKNFSAFANYARGFQAPSPLEINQFFDNPSAFPFSYQTLRNPDLEPETSETVEAGLRYVTKPFVASFTAFIGTYRNFISQEIVGGTGTVADPVLFQYINLDRVEIEGLEGRLQWRLGSGFSTSAAFAYARGDGTDAAGAQTPLITIDPLKIVAGLEYRAPTNDFGGQLILTHAVQKAEGRVAGLCAPSCFRPEGYVILDAAADVRVFDRFILRAGLFNIFDETYIEYADVRGLASTSLIADAFTQPGRNLSVSVSARF
jgi:hemoglobin/transferrin/lactoferrin receptor protein